jgi:glycosyltransferase involved in cell wall biosynthesis
MANEKIKILYVAAMQKGSGVASFLMNYFRHIDRTKISFYFLSNSNITNSYDSEITHLGGEVFNAPYYKDNVFKYFYFVNKIIKNNSFDIIHCHDFIISIFSLIVARKKGIKTRVIHSHSRSIDSPVKKCIVFFSRFLFRLFATDFFACSEEAGHFLFGTRCKPVIINNAIDVNKFRFDENVRRQIRSQLCIGDNYKIIGHVGRFSKEKNHIFLIKVFADILLDDEDCILLLVGEGEKQQDIKNIAVNMKIVDKVIFYGLSNNTAELYSAMDVFVFPSLHEGLGVVGIEAQCAGLPVIASKNIPKQMQISDLVTWLDLNEGSEIWAHKVLECIKKTERKNMSDIISQAGYNIVLESKKLENKYVELLNNRTI